VDVTPFTRLPLFVGMIQSADTGFRAVLRSKANLNDAGDPIAAAEDVNSFMAMEAFQVHVTELGTVLLMGFCSSCENKVPPDLPFCLFFFQSIN